MSYFIQMFKNLSELIRLQIRGSMDLARVQITNTSCKFYPGVKISDSKFGRNNVVFEKALIINSEIGSHTYIQRRTVIINAVVGKFCSIAANVSIGPGIHKVDLASTHPSFYLLNTPLLKTFIDRDSYETSKRTSIGNDVWIGEKAIIMDGVNIGNGAVVAAGAVVTRDVAPYSISGGVPARHIRYRFSQDIINELENLRWWDQSDEWLSNNANKFLNVDELIKSK